MRRLPVFIVLSVAAINLYALTLTDKEKTPDRPTTQTEQEKTTPRRDTTPAPVKNYTPTEKIRADSAVSFPVDI
ncbi:MAG: hypothetical protein ACE5FQ_15565 [Thiogranum sp.]